MLEITLPKQEMYDEQKEEFIDIPEVTLHLEHSLVSLSKWESKWEIPFLNSKEMTDEQTTDYIYFMIFSPNVPENIVQRLTSRDMEKINAYISKKSTATWFSNDKPDKPSREVITSELIYYWMVSLTIPFECETWNLSRLLTLIRVCNEKNQPAGKKLSKSEIASRNRSLNAQRRNSLGTSG